MKFKFITDYTQALERSVNDFVSNHDIVRIEFLSNDKYGRVTALIQYNESEE